MIQHILELEAFLSGMANLNITMTDAQWEQFKRLE